MLQLSKEKRRELQRLIDANNARHARKHKGVSFATESDRALALFRFFRDLHERLDFDVWPTRLRLRHVKALLQLYEAAGQSASSLQKTASYLRTFSAWIGKPGMISGRLEDYLQDSARGARTYAAQSDGSWEAHGVSADELIDRIREYDPYVGAQLLMQQAFGLRPKEAYMLRPHEADKGTALTVDRGTKGGRAREVPIDTELKRLALTVAKSLVTYPNSHLGRPGLSLKQSQKRFYNVLAKFRVTRKELGVTGYGLRKAYGNDLYETLTGEPSPVRGGPILPKSADHEARRTVAAHFGHSRKSISNAYLGRRVQPKEN